MWTFNNRLKPEKITDIRIHPNTKAMVILVFRVTNKRTFNVYNSFAFGEFGLSELDEPREIIPKKKNTMVKDLMNSLGKRYDRLRKIPEELGIKSALPTIVYEQATSKPLSRKRKMIELEPEVRIPRLECNRALLENVPFVKNMVIEEHELGILFTDVFGDRAFQR
ncbi:hypothetical protein Tco_0146829 [Tanacetum coccineum]